MFLSRKLNHRSNNIHEKALILVYKDYGPSFDDLLVKNNSVKLNPLNASVSLI